MTDDTGHGAEIRTFLIARYRGGALNLAAWGAAVSGWPTAARALWRG